MSHHIGKKIAVDNFQPVRSPRPSLKNFPVHIDSVVTEYWTEPSVKPQTQSGKEFVRVEDGRVFERWDHYVQWSPYGWREIPADKDVKD